MGRVALSDPVATDKVFGGTTDLRVPPMTALHGLYGETSSSIRFLVSIAKNAVTKAVTNASPPKARNTDWSPVATMKPTTVGPIMDARRSQAVATPTPIARIRVG